MLTVIPTAMPTSYDSVQRAFFCDMTSATILAFATTFACNDPPYTECTKLPGVTCHDNKTVSEIVWTSVSIRGSLPTSIGNLVELTKLDMNYNELIGVLPSTMAKLTKLRHLGVVQTLVQGTVPDIFGSLTSLSYLSINIGNATYSPFPSSLCMLHSLTCLSVHRAYSGSLPACIFDMSLLQILNLNSNLLTGPIPSSIGNLLGLTWLNIGYNRLDGVLPTQIGQLKLLKTFIFPNNRLQGSLPSTIGSMTSLTRFDIWNNSLTGPVPDSVLNLTNLRMLRLYDNSLNGYFPQALCERTYIFAMLLTQGSHHECLFPTSIPTNAPTITSKLTNHAIPVNLIYNSNIS